MAYQKLSLESLDELDGGRVREAWDQELAKVDGDLRDRPGLKAARKVVLTLTVKPVFDDETKELCGSVVKCDINAALPKRSSKEYAMHTAEGGGLFFNNYAPENPHQKTIDDAMAKESNAS